MDFRGWEAARADPKLCTTCRLSADTLDALVVEGPFSSRPCRKYSGEGMSKVTI